MGLYWFRFIEKQFDIQIHSKLFKVDCLSSVLGLLFHIKCWYLGGRGGGGGALDTSYDKVLRCVQTNLILPNRARSSLIWCCTFYIMGLYNA